ncbi:MAG TPA: hypothetical protein VLM85_26305 [Polyangiaceae bacterium]|nr:hypothetical protein [Polyangiaceae bacterium]
MKSKGKIQRKLAAVGLVLAGLATMTGCYADDGYGYGYATTSYGVDATPSYGYGYGYAGDGEYGYGASEYPSAAYVATTSPYYYEGRPTYWYNNRWNYMENGRWNHYRAEPAELGRYRAGWGGRVRGGGPAMRGEPAMRGGSPAMRGEPAMRTGSPAMRGGSPAMRGRAPGPSRHFYEKPTLKHYAR